MGKRGRPRKIKTLEQYTVSELRSMPMASMIKLFMSDIVGKKAVVASPLSSSKQLHKEEKKGDMLSKHALTTDEKKENQLVAEMIGMPLDKKADYLADALMGYLKKTK
jgi:hypothetical protein